LAREKRIFCWRDHPSPRIFARHAGACQVRWMPAIPALQFHLRIVPPQLLLLDELVVRDVMPAYRELKRDGFVAMRGETAGMRETRGDASSNNPLSTPIQACGTAMTHDQQPPASFFATSTTRSQDDSFRVPDRNPQTPS
jgi:hypothetical protein